MPYQHAWDWQRRLASEVGAGRDPALMLLQHPPVYTLGARGKTAHLLLTDDAYRARGADVIATDRGGDVTFHGPGQVVAYAILDLRRAGLGAAAYVRVLESILIDVLAPFGIEGGRSPGRPGVWVGDDKIAAIGVRVSRGVTTHGVALNVNTDIDYFDDIVPCGLTGAGVTSMQRQLACAVPLADVEDALAGGFARAFGWAIEPAATPAAEFMEASVGR